MTQKLLDNNKNNYQYNKCNVIRLKNAEKNARIE
jgi:hypothetical protein